MEMEQSCILYRSSLSYNHSWRLSPSLIPSLHPPSSTAINGADEVVPDVTDATALVLACAHGRLATVRYLLSQGADANPPLADPTQRSPLIAALQRPRVDAAVVEALLGAGADVEATLTQRYTMATTFFVLRRNDADPRVLDALLDAGAPLEGLTTKAAHMNAVWCTARTGRLDLLERVIARGGEVKGEMGAWALANAGAKAAGGARTPELMHALYLTLLNAGAGFEFRGDYDDHVCFHLPVWQEPDRATPLGEATVPFLELLAERGCVLVGLRLFRSSLLHYYAGLPAVLAWLIDHGHAPDRDAHNNREMTPIRYLLAKRPNIGAVTRLRAAALLASPGSLADPRVRDQIDALIAIAPDGAHDALVAAAIMQLRVVAQDGGDDAWLADRVAAISLAQVDAAVVPALARNGDNP